MKGRTIDVAIAGGGLAGGLVALALHRAHPDLRLALVEGGPTLGGNHRWSWFSSDLTPEGAALLEPFHRSGWRGYDVRFPAYERKVSTGYNSLASHDFDAALHRLLPEEAVLIGRDIAELDARGIDLSDGTRIEAGCVIDARGLGAVPHLRGGWQVFMGRAVETQRPHGFARPTIMDARVEQHGAYRFVYVLPLGTNEVFVEDTYYADEPCLDRKVVSGRLDRYCAAHGIEGRIVGEETGVLPVVTGGSFSAFQGSQRIEGVACVGARGGFWHPLTSYTLPFAVSTALAIAQAADLSGPQLAAMVEDRARRHWQNTRFYRALGRMLFDAEPAERYRIFEHFYRVPEDLIERFYAVRSTPLDRLRVLCGKPPMPIPRAIAALAGHGAPLHHEAA